MFLVSRVWDLFLSEWCRQVKAEVAGTGQKDEIGVAL